MGVLGALQAQTCLYIPVLAAKETVLEEIPINQF
jgi:hypothetical protein